MTNHSCRTCRKYKENMWCVKCNYEPMVQADVVEVVRCKNCKHRKYSPYEHEFIGFVDAYDCKLLGDYEFRFNPRHYCSYGEREEA